MDVKLRYLPFVDSANGEIRFSVKNIRNILDFTFEGIHLTNDAEVQLILRRNGQEIIRLNRETPSVFFEHGTDQQKAGAVVLLLLYPRLQDAMSGSREAKINPFARAERLFGAEITIDRTSSILLEMPKEMTRCFMAFDK